MARVLDLDHYRLKLEQERDRLQHQIAAVAETEEQSDSIGELSDYDDQPADMGTDTFQREHDQTVEATARDVMDRIEAAERKMAAGTYGVCDICGKDIPAERLEAVSYATLCVKCQTDIEGP